MICSKCKTEIRAEGEISFCPFCGARLDGRSRKGITVFLAVLTGLLIILLLFAAVLFGRKYYEERSFNAGGRAASALTLKVAEHEGYVYPFQTFRLELELFPARAEFASVEFSSSDESVASVDAAGNVSVLREGDFTITAVLDNGVSASISLTSHKKPGMLDFVPESIMLGVGEELELKPNVIPYDAEYESIRWESRDSAVVRVDENGKLKAVSPGRTTVSAFITEGVSDELEVTVYRYKLDLLLDAVMRGGRYDEDYGDTFMTVDYRETRDTDGTVICRHVYLSCFPDSDRVSLCCDMYDKADTMYYRVVIGFDRYNRSSAEVEFYSRSKTGQGSDPGAIHLALTGPKETSAEARLDLSSYKLGDALELTGYEGDETFRELAETMTASMTQYALKKLKENWDELGVPFGAWDTLGFESP